MSIIKNDFFSDITSFEEKGFKNFFLSFTIYTICYTVMNLNIIRIYSYLQFIQLICLAIMFFSFKKLVFFRIENAYLRAIFTLNILWVFVMIFRGTEFNYDFIKGTLTNPYKSILVYFVPLVILMPLNYKYFKQLFNIFGLLALSYILLVIVSFKYIFGNNIEYGTTRAFVEYLAKSLSFPTGFVFLTYKYQHNRYKFLSLIAIFVTTITAMQTARRGLLLLTVCIILFSLLGFIRQKSKLFFVMIFTYILLFVSSYFINYDKIFIKLNERSLEDTRSGVEYYFFRDFQTIDWIIGRGINGSYYFPIDVGDGTERYRNDIETDYLNLILKGGIIHLALLLLMAVPAAFLCIFSSNNFFSKAAGFWIIIWLISLYPTSTTSFSMGYILVWISVAIGYSPYIRKLPDKDLIYMLTAK